MIRRLSWTHVFGSTAASNEMYARVKFGSGISGRSRSNEFLFLISYSSQLVTHLMLVTSRFATC